MSKYSLLIEAVTSEDLRFLEDFLNKNENDLIKLADTDGITCLHIAAGLENNEILQCLLAHGAEVDCQTSEGLTPLHIAAMWGRSEQVVTLLQHGATTYILDENGCDAVVHASNSQEEGSQACIDLIETNMQMTQSILSDPKTPESVIDFDRLNNSPWITPRKSKSSRQKAQARGTSMFSNDSFENLDGCEDLMTEMSSELLTTCSSCQDDQSSLSSNSPTFSYSTITCLDSQKLESLSNIEDSVNRTSTFLTECSLEEKDGYTCSSGNESENNELEHECADEKEDVVRDGRSSSGEDSCVYETADEMVGGDLTQQRSNETYVKERRVVEDLRQQQQNWYGDDEMDERKENAAVRQDKEEGNENGSSEQNVEKDWNGRKENGNGEKDGREDGEVNTEEVLNVRENDETVLYDWREISLHQQNEATIIPESYKAMSCAEIRKKLKDNGRIPGPITPQTKMLYVKKLWRLEQGIGKVHTKDPSPCSKYPVETRLVLMGKNDIPDLSTLEQELIKEFCKSPKNGQWRGGTEKSSFNYLLLDPRVTLDLPQRNRKLTLTEAFRCFVLSIFYVGKGKRSRPYAHLHEAVKYAKSKSNKKLDHIWDIWGAGLGVISLHLFQSAIPVEAFTREACMVEALGLSQLTNQKRGEYYGQCSDFALPKKRKLGIFCLFKAFQIFLQEGERQICKDDL